MPLPTFDTEADVPDAVKAGYVERDGKWVPDVEDVAGLKSAYAKVKKRDEERGRALLAFGDLTAEEAAELREIKARQAAGDGGAGAAQPIDVEKIVAKRESEWRAKHLDPLTKERESLASELRRLKLDDRVKAAALKAGVLSEDVDDVLAITLHGQRARFDLNDTGAVVVLDDDGDPMGKTVEQYFAEDFKKARPKFYAGTNASGGGAQASSPGAKGMTHGMPTDVFNKLPPAERLRLHRASEGKAA